MPKVVRKDVDNLNIVLSVSLEPKDYEPKYIDKYTFVDWWGKVYRLEPKLGINYWIDGILKTEEDLEHLVINLKIY